MPGHDVLVKMGYCPRDIHNRMFMQMADHDALIMVTGHDN